MASGYMLLYKGYDFRSFCVYLCYYCDKFYTKTTESVVNVLAEVTSACLPLRK